MAKRKKTEKVGKDGPVRDAYGHVVRRDMAATPDADVKRVPVDFDFTGLNWDFLEQLAMIPPYAAEKYGSWEQYTKARLKGEKSPLNHTIKHIRDYMLGKPYDKFDGGVGRHLVAAAYNLMMEWYYLQRFGFEVHPLKWPEWFRDYVKSHEAESIPLKWEPRHFVVKPKKRKAKRK